MPRADLIGPFFAIKYAGPVLVRQGSGSIVCTASVAGVRANAGGSPCAASKAGVISLVQTGANERAHQRHLSRPHRDGQPSRCSTGRAPAAPNAKIGQLTPLRRYGEPREIAHGIVSRQRVNGCVLLSSPSTEET